MLAESIDFGIDPSGKSQTKGFLRTCFESRTWGYRANTTVTKQFMKWADEPADESRTVEDSLRIEFENPGPTTR